MKNSLSTLHSNTHTQYTHILLFILANIRSTYKIEHKYQGNSQLYSVKYFQSSCYNHLLQDGLVDFLFFFF